MRRIATVFCGLGLVVTACGSTANPETAGRLQRWDGLGDPSGGARSGPSPEAALDPAHQGDRHASIGRVAGASVLGQPSPGDDRRGPGDPVGELTAASKPPIGPGVRGADDTHIFVGFQRFDTESSNAAAAALGLGDSFFDESIDGETIRQAVIDHVNATGGIAGRRVEPVLFDTSAANGVSKEGRRRDAQAACATYTEDHAVFAFTDSGMWQEENIVQCAADQNVVLVITRLFGAPMTLGRYREIAPHYLAPDWSVAEERDRLYVERLVAEGLLPADAKVGLLVEDRPTVRDSVTRALKPTLAASGIDLAAEAVYPDIIESPWETYVLAFAQAGVTHVLFSTSSYGYWPVQMFTRAAENQRFRPVYALGSEQSAYAQVLTGSPTEQLANMVGVGWYPPLDTSDPPPAPGTDRCADALERAGLLRDQAPYAALDCEYLFLLQDGLAAADEVSPTGLASGLASVGERFQSQLLAHTRFRPGRPDGATSWRPFRFGRDCECFRYTGPAHVTE